MAKHDWSALLAAFLSDNAETGITAQRWCEERGLNYQSARRYIKPRSAQSAQKKVRKTAHSAQKGKNAQKCAKGGNVQQDNEDESTDVFDDDAGTSRPDAGLNGRDEKGRFTEGNPGNPNAVSPFVPGHRHSVKHNAYSQYLPAGEEFFAASREAELRDELIFTRARALSVTKTLNKIMEDLQNAPDIETRIDLYDKMLKAEQGLDRNIARIESLENSLSKLQIDAVNVPRLTADTYRIKAATAKLKAETAKLTADNAAVVTPLTEVVDELQESNKGGLI
ncbi:terminase [Brenneria corticis]|uniref:Terminase n=1 Tax=Brenneria corticis TaxID=2173106 RepID=A0A2U1TM92_9GAMM|nr:terminase [Brenneria sp. CFCC 11842]PWC10538.1 terminase [Brenneria sp. CFCC 11842]